MKNIVLFETAKRLKEAGFPQPEYEVGQIWFGDNGRACVFINDNKRAPILTILNGRGKAYILDGRDDDAFFAPTAADILREIGKKQLWKMAETPVGFGEIMRIIIDPEAAAAAWLEINEK